MFRRVKSAEIGRYLQSFAHFQRNARLYLISNGLSGVTIGIILVLYNLYIVELGYGTDFIGLILFMGTIGAGAAIFPAGACVDRFGGKAILIAASLLIGVAGAGQILFRTPLLLLVSALLVGVGGAFILVVNAPFLTAHSSEAERPQLFSLNLVLVLATMVLGEVIGGGLPHWLQAFSWWREPLPPGLDMLLVNDPVARSYQVALLLAGVISAPSFLPLFLMKSDRPPHPPPLTIISRLPWLSRRGANRNAGAPTGQPRLNRPKIDLRAILNSSLLVIVIMQALIGLGAGLFIPYFNVYFVRELGASSTLFGIIDGAANLLNALLLLLAPWLALRLGKVAAILFPRLLSLPVLLVIGLSAYLPLAALLYPLRQGLMDMSQGILQLFSMEVVAPQRRGLANSSYQVAYQVAWACSAPIGGLVIKYLGFGPVFLGAILLYLLALALFWWRFGRGTYGGPDDTTGENDENVGNARKEIRPIL